MATPDPTFSVTYDSSGRGAGLYVHIPFCRSRCRYCDFHSGVLPHDNAVDTFLGALEREWDIAREQYALGSVRFDTVYIGGGTPSVLSIPQWRKLAALVRRAGISEGYEWTIECNPDSFSEEKAEVWLESGVNRLSVGVQTLDDRLLRFLGRPHTSAMALEILDSSVLRAFDSVGVDIMYGLPGQSVHDVESTVERLLAFETVTHLSAYELTIAPRTPLGRHKSLLRLPDQDTVVAMYESFERTAARHGFEHYEVSNYARPGHRSRHNCAYWSHKPYLGLGPSAHSYLPPYRIANVADTTQYVERLTRGELPVGMHEQLDREALVREALMLGFRTADGVDAERFCALTARQLIADGRGELLGQMVAEGFLRSSASGYQVTSAGMLVADALAARIV